MTEASEAHGPTGPSPIEPSHAEAAPSGQAADAARQVDDSQARDSHAPGPQQHESSDAAAQSEGGDREADAREGVAEASDSAEPGDAGEASDAGEAGEGEGTSAPEGAVAEGAPAGEGAAKRKRRRRKKGKTRSESGEQDAVGEGSDVRARRRENSMAPFLRFFSGSHAGRKHGFAVEEAVAGRVKEVAHGTITVDLFGKAIAFVDEHEPREVPPPLEVTREPAPERAAASTEAGAELAAASAEGASAEVGSAEVGSAVETPPVEPQPVESQSHDDLAAPAASSASEASVASQQEPVIDASSEGTAVDAASIEASEAGETSTDYGDDADGETTLSGEASPLGHGPLPPAPVVPESYPRLEEPRVGQVFRGRVGAVSESGHIAIVNRHVDRKAVLANLERYRAERRRVQGLVFGFNRGGFDVLVEGARAFCPASAMSLEEIEDPTQYLGQKLEFLLPASQAVTKDIIVSRRSILERLQRKKARDLVRSLEPGQRIKGRVTQVREFGVFVDIGGIEGLVHQSELSFAHNAKPSDAAQVGDEIEVQVLRVGAEPSKRESGKRDRVARVSLSVKALLPDPWDAHADALKEGTAQTGKVTRTTDFGAFIELAPQIEGLLHITELGRDLKHASQAVKEGDELQVVIERVDRRARRISLSKLSAQEAEELQAAAEAGESAQSVRPGARIKVKVARVEPRGLVVRVAGVLGRRARGYVPGSELPGGRGGDLRKAYPVGSELEVKVVGVDRDGGLRCSPKALAVDEERKAVKDYRREAAKQGFGTFGDLLRAKLGGQADPK
jgi:small subunit ribosomal protein S1